MPMVAFRGAPPPFIGLVDHRLRWRLLTELAAGDQRVRDLVEQLGQPQSLVSYHLRVLRVGGLVTARRSSHSGRDTYYHLDLDRCADGLARTGGALHPSLQMAPVSASPAPAVGQAVLFVCSGNSARSPIAEALFRRRTGAAVRVASAGIVPKDRIHPSAVRVLRERFDVDIRDQQPRSIAEVLGADQRFDHVVTLCDKARERLPVGEVWRRAHWSIPDPSEARGPKGYSAFVAVASDIDTRVRHLMAALAVSDPKEMEATP